MSRSSSIEVIGARTHNLKGVDCRVPHGRLTVVTGPSGAGKSSLAFDTLYAEGQRRYVESISTYARQFLDQMERPPVDSILNLPPAIALEARNSIRNARATVGTLTEVHDVLRLLYTHLGEVECAAGHGALRRWTTDEIVDDLRSGALGARFLLVAEMGRPSRGADLLLQELVRQGFRRRWLGEEMDELDPDAGWAEELDPLPLAIGRFRTDSPPGRLAESIEQVVALRHARLVAIGDDGRCYYSDRLTCPTCGDGVPAPTPALFSFNSPLGACPECEGFGRVIGIDRDRVVPDPGQTLAQGPIAPWNTPAYDDHYERLYAECRRRGIPTDVPWRDLPEEIRQWIWSGSGDFVNLERFFGWLEKRIYKVHVRVLLARFRSYDPCPACDGTRFRPEVLRIRLHGERLPDLTRRSLEDLREWIAEQRWTPSEHARGGQLIEALERRVEVLCRVGLDYLTLDRQARTLSGGETQRIHLAAALGSGLTSTLYVLDEPTIGLHPRDTRRLLALLKELAAAGNTVLVVEHDREIIQGAEHLIDLGPAAGRAGGELMAEGPPERVLANRRSSTARHLSRRPRRPARQHLEKARRERGDPGPTAQLEETPKVEIVGASAHNLRELDVRFPATAFVVVTGVSGSGKSTLVDDVLYANYQRSRGVVDVDPGAVRELRGLDELEDVTLVDQEPLGRSSRSNPVTYVKAWDDIRKLYAATEAARRRGIGPGHFSFNRKLGRCPECDGTGSVEVDMQFMAPVTVTCDVCHGRRFRPEVLAIRCRGRTIAETLQLSVDEALEVFGDRDRLARRLRLLVDVGLGYVQLGQATSTLSGGEAQRLKLATFLDRPATSGRRLFLFDEPTTGLHVSDIHRLYRTLRRLVNRGDGVVVVEHNLDLIARADWIVDLGPGGGVHGGRLLFSGPVERFLESGEGPTAHELRRHLGRGGDDRRSGRHRRGTAFASLAAGESSG